MIVTMISTLVILATVICISNGQFPAVCNNEESLMGKTCCPNSCNAPTRGMCKNITESVAQRWAEVANQTVVDIIKNAPNEKPAKGTIDSRYLWPTMVYENVCECHDHYGGIDCGECDFGWTGKDCSERKKPVLRRDFGQLSDEEKERVANATLGLKNEMGYWSVVIKEPDNYTTSETVVLQNVSTYDYFIYLHNFVARGGSSECTTTVNKNVSIDFAHSGAVFPVWHRRYVLTVEKEFQRYLNDSTFGLPYWKWEENSQAPFNYSYYGEPPNEYSPPAVNVSGRVINPEQWNTICDNRYWASIPNWTMTPLTCEEIWKPCNPADYLAKGRPLQRGPPQPINIYLPGKVEVMIALAAPSYDAPDSTGQYFRFSPRSSFRSRLEGWNQICSKEICVSTTFDPNRDIYAHMHNLVHDWVGGQMDVVPAAVNDPIFNLHHCNVDRILESWMQKFAMNSSIEASKHLLPPYIPVSDGHPGHNRDDYMVPFFPVVKPGVQYNVAKAWGYMYDELIEASIEDYNIQNCDDDMPCAICAANGTCINCTNQSNDTCPAITFPTEATTDSSIPVDSNVPQPGGVSDGGTGSQGFRLGLGFGLGLGVPILITIIIAIIVIVFVVIKKRHGSTRGSGVTGKPYEEQIDIGEPEDVLPITEDIEETAT